MVVEAPTQIPNRPVATKNPESGEKSVVLVWSAVVFPARSRVL